MSQSLTQLYLHIVYSTKGRATFLQDKLFRDRLHGYMVGICRNMECPSIAIGGVADHIHILCRFSKNLTVAAFLRDSKKDSSAWVKSERPDLADFYWQGGYGAFSISPSHVDALRDYICNQEEHHRKVTFQDEFRQLCRKYGIENDERYVWD
jgi:REP element-mobilizing transposase RayT